MQPVHPYAEQVAKYRPLSELVPSRWQTGYVDAEDGTRLHYTRTGGDKPAVVLLHGYMGAGLMWLRTALALEADYDVVMPDLRGRGLSGRLSGELSMQLFASDVAAVIRALGLEKPFVVGHSFGAEVAGQLAALYPDLARGAVLVDPILNPPPVQPDSDMPPWMESVIQTITALKTQPHEQRLLTALNLLPPDTQFDLWDEADYVGAVEAVAQFDTSAYRYPPDKDLMATPEKIARIACPLLLMSSRPLPGMAQAPGVGIYEANWRDGQHVHFADSGHFIPCERFERFMEVLRHFLRGKQGQVGDLSCQRG